MSTRGKRSTPNRTVQLSKNLSYILRHGAEKMKLELDKGGYAKIQDIMSLPDISRGKYTFEEVQSVVANCAKQRFHLEEREGGVWYIRANQGHSIEVEELSTKAITLENMNEYPTVVHGTYQKSWPLIKAKGLSKMGRNHIHFAKNHFGAEEVISGMRQSCNLMIYVNLKKALEDGIKFEESANGVVLTSGIDGFLPTKYFEKVVTTNFVPFDPDFQ